MASIKNFRTNKLAIGVGVVLAIPIALEILLRTILGVSPELPMIYTRPSHFFVCDSLLAWKNGVGHYSAFLRNSDDLLFDFTTNEQGHRITRPESSDTMYNSKPTLHLYGCSYTFGHSIADTSTMAYKLQCKMPEYNIINKGVSGYGLAQMFLSLQKSLAEKDTPRIAVFNYLWFQDVRTPLYEQYSGSIWASITKGNKEGLCEGSFPYFDTVNGNIQMKLMPLNKIPKNWPYTDHSALLIVLNQIYRYDDDAKIPHLHTVTRKLALQIMQYCESNHILPIFAEIPALRDMDPDYPCDIIDSLKANGFNAFRYSIDASANKYNCSPKDPSHPNGLANSIFSQTLSTPYYI